MRRRHHSAEEETDRQDEQDLALHIQDCISQLMRIIREQDPAGWPDFRHNFQFALAAPHLAKLAFQLAETNANALVPGTHGMMYGSYGPFSVATNTYAPQMARIAYERECVRQNQASRFARGLVEQGQLPPVDAELMARVAYNAALCAKKHRSFACECEENVARMRDDIRELEGRWVRWSWGLDVVDEDRRSRPSPGPIASFRGGRSRGGVTSSLAQRTVDEEPLARSRKLGAFERLVRATGRYWAEKAQCGIFWTKENVLEIEQEHTREVEAAVRDLAMLMDIDGE